MHPFHSLVKPVALSQQNVIKCKKNCIHRSSIFLFNNQPYTLDSQILFCNKTLHVSGIFSALHQDFSSVNPQLVSFMQVSDDRFQAEPAWNCIRRSILTTWKRSSKTCMKLTSDECTIENSWWWADKMHEIRRVLWHNKIFIISASGWLLKRNLLRCTVTWIKNTEEASVCCFLDVTTQCGCIFTAR